MIKGLLIKEDKSVEVIEAEDMSDYIADKYDLTNEDTFLLWGRKYFCKYEDGLTMDDCKYNPLASALINQIEWGDILIVRYDSKWNFVSLEDEEIERLKNIMEGLTCVEESEWKTKPYANNFT